jgi:fructosamine-3-kinase
LKGGQISLTRRLNTDSGSLILKQSRGAPPDMYALEAESLRVLRGAGLRAPDVLAVSPDYLLLEDVGNVPRESIDWEALGRAIARLHQNHNTRVGFDHDNYLGLLPQLNGWMEDGYAFFAEQRVLRYLREPLCQQTLTAEDQRRIERLMARLPDLIPPQPASLLHGDLWSENILADRDGVPTVIDPAVYYGWAEAELAMVRQCGGVPDAFYAAYNEVNPLQEGWWERLEILYIREDLSVIAHFGNWEPTLQRIRALLDRYV